ncbi:MAG: anaerobic ribonucleoside-triphosphate reductase activating protein [Candidatus Saccharibacteria bacterium]|nr:anaerobic ribonucleoside-triphosphate reductase activating protein [Candidatus Saccharibacteria bacterium]
MRYHNITTNDMLNGDGLRVVLWVAGCNHACPGCHNPVTWDRCGGLAFDDVARQKIFCELGKEHIDGVTLSGGDPLHPANRQAVLELTTEIKQRFPKKTVWVYTGYLWEEVCNLESMHYIDVLLDGRFVLSKRRIGLKWIGSSNQRIIDVPKTLSTGEIKLFLKQ